MFQCPDCPFTADSEQGVAQHMSQKQDHEYKSYSEARRRLDSADAETAAGGDTGADQGGEGVDPVRADDRLDDPGPHHTSPAVHFEADGGEEIDAADVACPECGETMVTLDGGTGFQGLLDGDLVAGETGSDDRYCPECSIIETDDGMTIRRVVV